MIHQSWEFGKAIRLLFAEPVTYMHDHYNEKIVTVELKFEKFKD